MSLSHCNRRRGQYAITAADRHEGNGAGVPQVVWQSGEQALIRRLVVLKLWQARDTFDPARLIQKFQDGRDFDWDDLRQLLNRAAVINRDRITADCVRGFGFLANPTDDERTLAYDEYQREQAVADRLRAAPARG
jgi:hypothetical protein